MINQIIMVCSLIVQYPDRTEYVDINPCRTIPFNIAMVEVVKLRNKHNIPQTAIVTSSHLSAKQNRDLAEWLNEDD